MKLFAIILCFFSTSVFADNINCLGELEDGYQVSICKNVIDLSKVRTINCMAELEDGYQAAICVNAINPSTRKKLNCHRPQDGYEYNLCTIVPEPQSIHMVNCLGELEDGYQVNRCENVDVEAQRALWVRLKK
jgi:hypothetical protein